jgi:hypothetical protein
MNQLLPYLLRNKPLVLLIVILFILGILFSFKSNFYKIQRINVLGKPVVELVRNPASISSLVQLALSAGGEFNELPISKSIDDTLIKSLNAETEATKTRKLADVLKVPENPENKNLLVYPQYGITVPIKYAGLKDLFETAEQGELLKDTEGKYVPIVENVARDGPLGVPIQKLLIGGIVHVGFTALPGEIGNSYIVGHSSNFSSVPSDYNYIFQPLERKSQIGEEFTIYDRDGRKMLFRVFETAEVLEADTETAFKTYGDKRVVTLQCSILEWVPGQGLQPTKRWLTRGELVI